MSLSFALAMSYQKQVQDDQAKTALSRAARLLQEGWLTFREHCFEWNIRSVKVEGDHPTTVFMQLEWNLPEKLKAFDDQLVASYPDPRIKQALLTDMSCSSSIAYSYDLANILFSREVLVFKSSGDLTDTFQK
jgi:hypothetical protein